MKNIENILNNYALEELLEEYIDPFEIPEIIIYQQRQNKLTKILMDLYLLDNDNEDICPFLEKVENYYKKPINELIVSPYHYYIISHLAKEGLNHTIAQLGKYGLFINEVPFNQIMEYKNLKTAFEVREIVHEDFYDILVSSEKKLVKKESVISLDTMLKELLENPYLLTKESIIHIYDYVYDFNGSLRSGVGVNQIDKNIRTYSKILEKRKIPSVIEYAFLPNSVVKKISNDALKEMYTQNATIIKQLIKDDLINGLMVGDSGFFYIYKNLEKILIQNDENLAIELKDGMYENIFKNLPNLVQKYPDEILFKNATTLNKFHAYEPIIENISFIEYLSAYIGDVEKLDVIHINALVSLLNIKPKENNNNLIEKIDVKSSLINFKMKFVDKLYYRDDRFEDNSIVNYYNSLDAVDENLQTELIEITFKIINEKIEQVLEKNEKSHNIEDPHKVKYYKEIINIELNDVHNILNSLLIMMEKCSNKFSEKIKQYFIREFDVPLGKVAKITLLDVEDNIRMNKFQMKFEEMKILDMVEEKVLVKKSKLSKF